MPETVGAGAAGARYAGTTGTGFAGLAATGGAYTGVDGALVAVGADGVAAGGLEDPGRRMGV